MAGRRRRCRLPLPFDNTRYGVPTPGRTRPLNIARNLALPTASLLLLAGGAAIAPAVLAQAAPAAPAPSYEAEPGVYKLLSENDPFRVVLATWKPGRRDAWHAHAGAAAVYRLTDCKALIHTPDGKSRNNDSKAGGASFNPPVVSHSFENVGTNECQAVIVERE